MKHLFTFGLILIILISFTSGFEVFAMEKDHKTALLIIDIQNFYFPGGKWELENPEKAGMNAQKILNEFRKLGMTVIHVRHNSDPGGEIHESVKPLTDEKIITKNDINSFKGTDLLSFLKERKIEKLVICGMQTHMCLEAVTRAAHDYGFHCTVIANACATRTLEFNGAIVQAEDVHNSTLGTLSGTYAKVIDTKSFFEK